MNIDYKKIGLSLMVIVVIIAFYAISFIKKDKQSVAVNNFDLTKIKERGILRVITEYNSISYFIYKDEVAGFDYEIMERFAESIGVRTEYIIAHNHQEMYNFLRQGKGDIIATGLYQTNESGVAYSIPYRKSEQVLVQRKAGKYTRKSDSTTSYYQPIIDIKSLEAKDVFLTLNSPYIEQVKHLADTLGFNVNINLVSDERSIEDLINAVADAEIDYTVADKDLALTNNSFLGNLDLGIQFGKEKDLHYATRKSSKELQIILNEWLSHFIKSKDYKQIANKYFKFDRKIIDQFNETEYLTKGQISLYDNIIQYFAKSINWDWRLVAALMYQESKFDPNATSWAGAKGLMQLMPGTARQMGLHTGLYQPEQNIQAGTKYLQYLEQFWKEVPDFTQRIKFILASYNAGVGHIQDAARLAKKYGYSETEWDGNVEYFILYKSNPRFYNDRVVKYGYARGSETFNYVRNIIKKYFYYTDNINDSTNLDFALQQKDLIPFNGIDGVYNPSVGLLQERVRKELFVSKKLFEQNQDLVPLNKKNNPFDKAPNELFKEKGKSKKLFEQKSTLFRKNDTLSNQQLMIKNESKINQLEPR
ncbi:MAG TPA: transglycosylase SLT domain-containing protein [Chitinophagales bacterium]|nr:transglycosylase SLT domain-containing protein [Chitinophagales bacterium]MCB9075157.1 transglycosylase SLT domain-containing protein [Chitinophagales bacterium]HMU98913.1 transglycosylase SLT domain-containing protein [Chitinophagales bacterium]HMV03450.1 transglycosylase SLT domain-containing protein [Chitinophagales bacterium]HMW93579.1 transglycosylase SLT domain-containing protein [Chitinophagales bacterium]